MTIRARSLIIGIVIVAAGMAQHASAQSPSMNLLSLINVPEANRTGYENSVAEQVARSAVPTAKDAMSLVDEFLYGNPGGMRVAAMDARHLMQVTGLYQVLLDGPEKPRDLVWEVRLAYFGTDVTNVLWVSASTKAVKALFP